MTDREERSSAPMSDKQMLLTLLDQLIEIIEQIRQLINASESSQEGL